MRFRGPTPLTNLHICPSMVRSKLNNLRPSAAPGPDGISPCVLQEVKDQISLPLTIIFNLSITEGKVPKDWKLANVTPVFKKGSKSAPGNYRPISLTCILCKVMKSLLREAMILHLQHYDLISHSQHRFMAKKSCLTNLLDYMEKLTKLLDNGHDVDVCYLDFAKAFDKVPHQRLIAKLKAHGINGHIAALIEDWLTGRKQRVVINGSASCWADVVSGVPQGSCVGPLLFIIFINDIDQAVDLAATHLWKFAARVITIYI